MRIRMLDTWTDYLSGLILVAGEEHDIDPFIAARLIEGKVAEPYEVKVSRWREIKRKPGGKP
jgi:hypothetical protein